MFPLVFLLLAALSSDCDANPPENSTGLNFIVAFPENIAYYHPTLPVNKISITALYNRTSVEILKSESEPFLIKTMSMSAGQVEVHLTGANMELDKKNVSKRVLMINSNKRIVVSAFSSRTTSSRQSILVIPSENLGTEYLVPPLPYIPGTTDQVTLAVTEREPFKLVILNPAGLATVNVDGVELSVNQGWAAQVFLHGDNKPREVKSDLPVAVYLYHSCVVIQNCSCSLLQVALPPKQPNKLTFYVPPFLEDHAESFLLLSDSAEVRTFDPSSPVVELSGPAFLYHPGLLLPLIPETDFASCFAIHRSSNDATVSSLIVVPKDFTDGVRMGTSPLNSPEWKEMEGTGHMWTTVPYEWNKNIIWHTSSKMAVYVMGDGDGPLFGNPAPVISHVPDFSGCVLAPGTLLIGEAGSWAESVQFCSDRKMALISFQNQEIMTQLYREIHAAGMADTPEVWIGMRRNSQTGDWYWLDRSPLSGTRWARGEPGSVNEGQCAIMTLNSYGVFTWRDEDCCKKVPPLCYRGANIL